MDTGFEVDLVTALKEVIDNSRWKNLGPTEHFKAKTCTRFENEFCFALGT